MRFHVFAADAGVCDGTRRFPIRPAWRLGRWLAGDRPEDTRMAQAPTAPTQSLTGRGSVLPGRTLRERMWAARWCYLFMAPSLILTAGFTLYPTVMSWYFSLLDWS